MSLIHSQHLPAQSTNPPNSSAPSHPEKSSLKDNSHPAITGKDTSSSPPSKTSSAPAYHITISHQAHRHSQDHNTSSYIHHETSVSSRHTLSISNTGTQEPLLAGAKNILGSIEQRIAKEHAGGASSQEIETLLQQGLTGFEQGYREALAILGDTPLSDDSSVNDHINHTVGQLYQQVIEGIKNIELNYLGTSNIKPDPLLNDTTQTASKQTRSHIDNAALPQTYNTQTTWGNMVDRMTETIEHNSTSTMINHLMTSFDQAQATTRYQKEETFSFELTTTDGDHITVNAATAYATHNDQLNATNNKQTHQQQLTISITGDIDEQEHKAIEQLMMQVMTLADDFYQGNIGSAYQAAMELGYDRNEITSYAIHLKQVETFQATRPTMASAAATAYEKLTPEHPMHTIGDHTLLDSIGSFALHVLTLLESLEKSAEDTISPTKQHNHMLRLLEHITEEIALQSSNNRMDHFDDTIKSITQALS